MSQPSVPLVSQKQRQRATPGLLAGAVQVDPGAGSHSLSGLQLCPSDFFSRVRKPRVYKLVLTPLVSTST